MPQNHAEHRPGAMTFRRLFANMCHPPKLTKALNENENKLLDYSPDETEGCELLADSSDNNGFYEGHFPPFASIQKFLIFGQNCAYCVTSLTD